MTFTEMKNGQIRLRILQLLAQAPGYQANDGELSGMLKMCGHQVSHDLLNTQLSWMTEQGLLSENTIVGSLQVVKLTARGEDVAHGVVQVPGVQRPGPEDSI
ncbi:MAG: ArsR family transcriptional regulator [Proteobacteria bacterium]|nr:ArsR family transcriptional regulator [Pseudomonadota bacterium]MBU1648228.1 ArsR family transcriptional regulator [Pseudomonadota bacterium]